MRLLNGHPRLLEFLDALLRHGRARLTEVAQRLQRHVLELGIAIDDERPLIADAIRDAVAIGARDILLDPLLALVDANGEREALMQAAISGLPLTAPWLARALGDGDPDAAAIQAAKKALQRLAALSLATELGEGRSWVHRWTAAALRLRDPSWADRCARAGRARLAGASARGIDFDQIHEATMNFLDAGLFDPASELAIRIGEVLVEARQSIAAAAFAAEVLRRLPERASNWAPLAGLEADCHRSLGLGGRALERLQQINRVLQARADAEPERTDLQRDLAVSFERLGDLTRDRGQGEAARRLFEQALAIRQRLAAAEPDRADLQRDLSVSFNKLGNLMLDLGQGEAAHGYFKQQLAIAQRLADGEPDRADLQRDLATSLEHVALVDESRSLECLAASAAIREALAMAEPERADLGVEWAGTSLQWAVAQAQAGKSGVDAARRGVELLTTLQAQGRLPPTAQAMFDSARQLLDALSAPDPD